MKKFSPRPRKLSPESPPDSPEDVDVDVEILEFTKEPQREDDVSELSSLFAGLSTGPPTLTVRLVIISHGGIILPPVKSKEFTDGVLLPQAKGKAVTDGFNLSQLLLTKYEKLNSLVVIASRKRCVTQRSISDVFSSIRDAAITMPHTELVKMLIAQRSNITHVKGFGLMPVEIDVPNDFCFCSIDPHADMLGQPTFGLQRSDVNVARLNTTRHSATELTDALGRSRDKKKEEATRHPYKYPGVSSAAESHGLKSADFGTATESILKKESGGGGAAMDNDAGFGRLLSEYPAATWKDESTKECVENSFFDKSYIGFKSKEKALLTQLATVVSPPTPNNVYVLCQFIFEGIKFTIIFAFSKMIQTSGIIKSITDQLMDGVWLDNAEEAREKIKPYIIDMVVVDITCSNGIAITQTGKKQHHRLIAGKKSRKIRKTRKTRKIRKTRK